MLTRRRITAQPACTEREHRAGISHAAYLFLGCGAYPDGQVAFVLNRAALDGLTSSYAPLDSGSLEKHVKPIDASARWDDSTKEKLFQDYLGHGDDLVDFAGPYLATHFRDPKHYVSRAQVSQPDFAPYHGLEAASGDRRVFTIEVRAHEDVSFGSSTEHLLEIVVSRPGLLEEVPDDLLGKARMAESENEVLESVAQGIVDRLTEEAA